MDSYLKTEHKFFNYTCMGCGHRIDVPVYCGDRFCPICSIPRKIRIQQRLKFLCDQGAVLRGQSLKFLTLTIRNEKNLPLMLIHLIRSFRKLRLSAFWKHNIAGGAFVLEITGHPDNWHAHIHIVMVSYFVQQQHLVKLWLKYSGSRGVYINRITGKQAINYVSKYLSKPDCPDQIIPEINKALKGYRLFQPFGDWFSLIKKYVRPKSKCTECGHNHFYPTDMIYGKYPAAEYKEVNVNSPPCKTHPGLITRQVTFLEH